MTNHSPDTNDITRTGSTDEVVVAKNNAVLASEVENDISDPKILLK